MTLALYGKTRRRQSTLILLAVISVFAAFIGGVTWHNSQEAFAASVNIDPSAATCSDSAGTDDTHGAITGWDCTEGATATQLSDVGSSVDDNSSTGRVNIERDDDGVGNGTDLLNVTFPLPGISGTINSATISLWSSASDDPGVIALGTASNETRYGTAAPSTAPHVYNSANIAADVQSAISAAQTTVTVRIRMDCVPNANDCGALIDRVQLFVDYTPAAPNLSAIKVARQNNTTVTSITTANLNFDWRITITNTGGTAVAAWETGDVILTDDLPAGLTYGTPTDNHASVACQVVSSTLSCSATANFNTGTTSSSNIQVTVPVTAPGVGSYTNPAQGGVCSVDPGSAIAESNEDNNACSNTLTVTPPPAPDLTVTKVAKVGTNVITEVTLGTPFIWEFTLTNAGNSPAGFDDNDVVLFDDLPAGPTYGSPVEPTSISGFSCQVTGGDLICEATSDSFEIPANTSRVITVAVTPTSSGSLVNPGAGLCRIDHDSVVSESDETNNSCSSTVTVNPAAQREILIRKVAANTTHNGATFQFTASNYAGGPANRSITLAAAATSGDSSVILVPENDSLTVSETDSAGWTTTQYKVVNNNTGTAICGDSGFTTGATTSSFGNDANDYLVCFRNTPPTAANCSTSNVDACIALLRPIPPTQTPPAGVCSGINANFVIDVSGSVNDTELGDMKAGIQSFASLMGASSKYSGTIYASNATTITTGYTDESTFDTQVGNVGGSIPRPGQYTWTEGGINVGRLNNGTPLAAVPHLLFVVTDGSPNMVTAGDDPSGSEIGDPMTWVNAANQAIDEANIARTLAGGDYWVRVVRAGPADTSLPFSSSAADQAFADAVLARLAAGSAVTTEFNSIASALLQSSGCDANILKSNGTAVNGGTEVEWTVTLVNPNASAQTVTVTDANATLVAPFPSFSSDGLTAGTCDDGDTDLDDGLVCTVAAKSGATSGQIILKVRTPMPAFNVCQGTTVNNTAYLTFGDDGTGQASGSLVIAANPDDPSCTSTIVVHKIEEGLFDTTTDQWEFALSGGTTKPNLTIDDEVGTATFSGLANGTYAVTEVNGSALSTCTNESPAGSFQTFHGSTAGTATTQGTAHGNIEVTAAGQEHHVWFKNVPCPGTIAISKASDVNTVDAGGNATWTIAVTVAGNPTTSDYSVTDTLPTGWVIRTTGVLAPAFNQCPANIGLTTIGQGSGCILPAGTPAGSYAISIPVTAPPPTVLANCKEHTNSATLAGQGSTLIGEATATDGITVENCRIPKLTLAKSNEGTTNDEIGQGQNFTWVVTGTVSDGPTASVATISDDFPAGFTYVGPISASGTGDLGKLSCQQDGNGFDCTLATDAPNGTYIIKVVVQAPVAQAANTCTFATNTATASFAAAGQVDGTATDTVEVICPDLTIAKIVSGPSTINAGESATFNITVTNAGPGTAYNVVVEDNLSPRADWATASANCLITGTAYVDEKLTCTYATMAPGNTLIVLTAATTSPASCDGFPNSATVSADNETNTSNNSTLEVSVIVNCPDPSVSKSGNGTIDAGDNMVYTITVTPGGTGPQSVVLKDTPPAGFTWAVGGDYNNTDCEPDGATVPGGQEWSCTFSFANENAPAKVITLTAQSTTAVCGPNGLANTASISPAQGSADVDTSAQSNQASATIIVECPSVTLQKTAANDTINAGEQLEFTITVANAGPGTAKGFSLTDPLPAAGTDWSIDSQSGPVTCVIDGSPGAETLKCPATGTVDLAPTGVNPLVVTVVSPTDKTSCGLVTNTARITVTNNPSVVQPAEDSTTVNCPNVTVAKSTTTGTVSAGDPVNYTITVDNTGLGQAKNVVVNDPLPANATWSLTAPVVGCSVTPAPGPQVLSCTFATINPADPAIVIGLSGTTPNAVCGILDNTVTITATNEPDDAAALLNSANSKISVNCADIEILKTYDGSGTVNATDNIGFTITVTNDGDGVARGVTMTDTLPSNTGLAWTIDEDNSDPVCDIDGGVLTCDWPDLEKGESKSVHITSPTTRDTCGPVENLAGVTTTNDGSGNSPSTIQVNCPNVAVTKSVPTSQPNPVSAGETISFQIVLNVLGSGTAYNVMLNDLLPQNSSQWAVTTVVPALVAPQACNVAGLQLVCSFGDLTAGTSYTLTITGKAIGAAGGVTCGPLQNRVRVSAGNEAPGADNESGASIGVDCPSVIVAKEPVKGTINAGETAEWKITVTNNGAGTATDVVVTDDLPDGLTWSDNHANCEVTSGDKLKCEGGAFASMPPAPAAGSTIEIIVSATTTPANCTTLNNRALATVGNDELPGEETVQSELVFITVECPDIFVMKTAGTSPINAGDIASFTITVRNAEDAGTGVAKAVVITDQLPDNGITWEPDKDECTVDANALMTCIVGDLDPDQSFVVNVSGQTSAAQCGPLDNQASATATNEKESDESDNTSLVVTVTVECPDVTVSKTPDAGTVNAGEDIVFTIEVENTGDGDAYEVSLSDDLPDGFAWTPNPGDPTCTILSGTLECDWEAIASGEKETVTLTAPTTPAQCQEVPNTAVVDASNEADTGPASENNSDDGDVTVLCPDIEISKSGPETVDYGASVSFTIIVENIGDGVAKNVVVTEDLPDGIAWTSTSPGCGIENSTIVCKYDEILPGEENAKTIVVESSTVPATCDPIVNRVSVTAENEPAGTVGANSAEATVQVRCGTLQIIKIDQTAGGTPADGDWDFTVMRDGQPFALTDSDIALGGGSIVVEKVPFGSYTAAETEAIPGTCPRPNEAPTYRTTLSPEGAQVINGENLVVSFTFTNLGCGIVANAGNLEVHKIEDISGNGVQDPGEVKLGNWPITVTGPQFPGGAQFVTDDDGKLLFFGITAGAYTITEGSRPGYNTVGVVVQDGGQVFNASNQAQVGVSFEENVIVTFYNQPLGSIVVTKHAVTRHNNGPDVPALQDDDGWLITVTSAACGIDHQQATDANGIATFNNLLMCSDYVVSENPVNASSPGFQPVGATSVSGVTPGLVTPLEVSFTNRRTTQDPPCQDCVQQPTPTPSPTNTPLPTNTPTPTDTPAAPATSTPTPVSTTAGERTPGPGQPTPIAPSTGEGLFGGTVGSSNILLIVLGLGAVAAGMFVFGAGRRSSRER